jgi:D-glycero-beta-D-manno-heptose 1-phosphate adenylyltransferase
MLNKILPRSAAKNLRHEYATKNLVFTNGCFDLLHLGHVRYLAAARGLGDLLVVGLNGDESVRELKGQNRPINSQADRAEILAALEAVDHVIVFEEKRVTELLKDLRPDIYAKGGDYTRESLDRGERRLLEALGTRIEIVPLVEGKSTTNLIGAIKGGPK